MSIIAAVKNRFLRPKARRVVYTCLFGYSELFSDFDYPDATDVDFICVTDDQDLKSDFWNILYVQPSSVAAAKRSKGYKHRPHLFLGKYEESLYLDNIIKLKLNPIDVFESFSGIDSPIRMFQHPWRDCIYDEAKAVIDVGYDTSDVVGRQIGLYRSMGYPEHNGLNATGFMLRRHNDRRVVAVMETWHEQMMQYSHRDQLSFNFALWKHGLSTAPFRGDPTNNDLMEWPVVRDGKRLPRDFDDSRYLQLHSDIALGGHNPRRHYLYHGMDEGRAYK